MTSTHKRRLVVVQPVVPHYRAPLFAALASSPEFDLLVQASMAFPGSPPSVAGLPPWVDLAHPVASLPGGCYWQRNLSLPLPCGPGDVLVINGNLRILSNLPIVAQARRLGMGVVWWGHWRSPGGGSLGLAMRKLLMRAADAILLYTETEAETARGAMGRPGEIFAANNAISTDAIDRAGSQWDKERLLGFLATNDITGRTVLFCGRLRARPPSDLDLALRALQILAPSDPLLRLVVIGDGPDEGRLRRLAASLGLSGRVRWVGALYDEEQLAPWFLCAKCFVYPGAIGLSLLHAMSYGLPVVTHDAPEHHNPEFAMLEDAVNGVTFRRGDCESLARALRHLLDHTAELAVMSRNAWRLTHEQFTLGAMAARFLTAAEQASRISLERHGIGTWREQLTRSCRRNRDQKR